MADSNRAILNLFYRPAEPVFTPKGKNRATFVIPDHYYIDECKNRAGAVISQFSQKMDPEIPVDEIPPPDLSFPMQLDRHDQFSIFIPRHQKMASRLIDIFMSMKTYKELESAAVYCCDRVNTYMFIYALTVAISHHPNTKNLRIPSLVQVFPDKFLPSGIYTRAMKEAFTYPEGERKTIVIPKDHTASDFDMEHHIAYFREDVGVNLHHWHWHVVYPHSGDIHIVNKDRRGELFYYMHQQIIARYNVERLCNRMRRVERFLNFREPFVDGYFPKLDNTVTSKNWPGRHIGDTLKDVNRQDNVFDIQDLERWRDRIYEAIHTGKVMKPDGDMITLTERDGIDILGNIMESSILSVNSSFYGKLHNMAHMAISLCHDPDNSYLEENGVMGDNTTAMRDPIFYRLHAFVDDVFQKHKNMLPKYGVDKLDFPNVKIKEVQVYVTNKPEHSADVATLQTYWSKSKVDISGGLHFVSPGVITVEFTHLNHLPFTYCIDVDNGNSEECKGTVRIFLGPKLNEAGKSFSFMEQKNLMIEMDKFTVTLTPGSNVITRLSTESAVTIPFEQTFPPIDDNVDPNEQDHFCGCGWPQHMLLPKGNLAGYHMVLFVMISDYEGDKVEQVEKKKTCRDAASYCGVKDEKYPDARSMGYPFDRRPRRGVETMEEFCTDNMAIIDVIVKFKDDKDMN